MLDIAAINLRAATAVLTDDQVLPITNLFDCCAEATTDPFQAMSFVAGPDRDGRWYSARVDAFEGASH